MEITFEYFNKINIHIGTILSVEKNKKATKPALVLEIDFGKKIGVKKSSAQITHYYNKSNLIGKQILAICNFAPKNIAGIISEVLVLGTIELNGKVVLVQPTIKVQNGLRIS